MMSCLVAGHCHLQGREVTLRLTLQLPAEIKMCRPDPEDLMSKIYEGPEVCGKDKVEEVTTGALEG